ncbi:MAG: hypothetical protein C4300_01440, partial [Thermus sp.]
VDPRPLGEGQTSACGAPLSVVERAGAAGAVQQVHRLLVLHTRRRTFVWELQEPFCTFDYRAFCRLAWQRVQAELEKILLSSRAAYGFWLLKRLGLLQVYLPELAEMDLNPVIVSPSGAVAVDARVRVVPVRQGPDG